jgi:hypothetical protein
MTSTPSASSTVKKKLLGRIAASQRRSDTAKKAAKLAKLAFRNARQKFKDAKRAAKKLRKAVKALKAELAGLSVKRPARKPAAKRPVGKRLRPSRPSAVAAPVPEVVVEPVTAPAPENPPAAPV